MNLVPYNKCMVCLGNSNFDECFGTRVQGVPKRGFCEPAVCHRVYRKGPEMSAGMPGIQKFMPCSQKGPQGSGVTKSLCVSLAGSEDQAKTEASVFYLANVVKYWFLHS